MSNYITISGLPGSANVYDDTPGALVDQFTITNPDKTLGDHLVIKVTDPNGKVDPNYHVVASGSSYILELIHGVALSDTAAPINLTITVTDVTCTGAVVKGYAPVSQTITVTPVVPTITVHQPASITVNEDYPFLDQLPANTFMDPLGTCHLTYKATLTNGAALPSWLSFLHPVILLQVCPFMELQPLEFTE